MSFLLHHINVLVLVFSGYLMHIPRCLQSQKYLLPKGIFLFMSFLFMECWWILTRERHWTDMLINQFYGDCITVSFSTDLFSNKNGIHALVPLARWSCYVLWLYLLNFTSKYHGINWLKINQLGKWFLDTVIEVRKQGHTLNAWWLLIILS